MTVRIVEPDGVVAIWPQIEGYLQRALVRGRIIKLFEPVDLLAAVIRREWTLWIAEDGPDIHAAMLTRITQYPRMRVFHVFLIGGQKLNLWADEFRACTEAMARANGCAAMEAGGRDGWAKVGGYRRTGCLLQKDL